MKKKKKKYFIYTVEKKAKLKCQIMKPIDLFLIKSF